MYIYIYIYIYISYISIMLNPFLLHMNGKTKNVFTYGTLISFFTTRKLNS